MFSVQKRVQKCSNKLVPKVSLAPNFRFSRRSRTKEEYNTATIEHKDDDDDDDKQVGQMN